MTQPVTQMHLLQPISTVHNGWDRPGPWSQPAQALTTVRSHARKEVGYLQTVSSGSRIVCNLASA